MPDPSSGTPPSSPRRLVLPMLSGLLSGAAFAWLILHADGSGRLIGWSVLVLVTLALLPLGSMQRRMLREGKLSSSSLPRSKTYAQAALQWLVLGPLALWVAQGNAAPFDWSAFAWPDGPEALSAWVVVALILVALLRWGRRLTVDRRARAWLRAVYRHGASLIAPRSLGELRRFRAMAVLTSSAEEVAYRLAVPGGFALLWGAIAGADAAATAWPAAALSALLFGIAHSWQGRAVMFWTTVFGLVAAALMFLSGSVWPAIVLHVGWNLITGGMMHTVYRRRGVTS
ncbi:MAG: CPBP family intramembrane metalloprotease [Gammaproteobacteria bacterium]|nr:CPBP family intramembrane metalloprotease [Gammaproteobacteria bacterium]